MGICQKTENDIDTIYGSHIKEIHMKILLVPLRKLEKLFKPRLFDVTLGDIHEKASCSSSLNPMILVVHFLSSDDESIRKNACHSIAETTNKKNMTRMIRDVDSELSVYKIGETILLLLCLFKALKISSDCKKLEISKVAEILHEPSIWTAIISETILNVLTSPGADENLQMFFHSLFKVRLNRMESLISQENSLKKLHTKRSNPKHIVKRRLVDSINHIFVVLGWSGDYPAPSIEVFDFTTQKWSYFQRETPIMRAYHGVALIGCNLYIVGGFNGHVCLASTLCLNLKSRRWRRKSPMSMPRCYVFTLTYKDCIYAFGGHNGDNRLKSCERYDPRKNEWLRISDMMYRRSDAAGAELNGRFFVCGGFDGFEFHVTTEMYDPESSQWTLIGNLVNARSGHSMVSFDGQLFVLGGFNGYKRLKEVEKYNEETREWENYIPMLTGRSNFCCAVFKQEIYVIGGFDGYTTIADVEIFDKSLMDWKSSSSLNIHRSAGRACVMNYPGNINSCALNDFSPMVSENMEESSP